MNFTEQINKGIALLDEKGPENWREKINLDTLNLHDLRNCVLGQVFGDYGRGMDSLFGSRPNWLFNETNVEHGFEAPDEDEEGNYISRPYDDLTDAWREALSVSIGQAQHESHDLSRFDA